jgi:hypothetical protein
MKAQIGDGMSGIHLYFENRHNCDGSVVKFTRVQHFTPKEVTRQSILLQGELTTGLMNADRRSSSLDSFPRTLNEHRHHQPP